MSTKTKRVQQNPLIMRCHRLMEVFAKSDDERDFYLDRQEGFLIYVDLDKTQPELDELEKELQENGERYCAIPKLTFYEIKKIMEGFVNEKVYDIDTKEKLIDIIQSKEARENFLEFIYDHHSELEKWQQYYQEKFRVRIIEWLRNNQFDFVFEEDLEMTKSAVEKLKMNTFTPKAAKDIVTARKLLVAKAKTYYSNEALNPRPKRGRPPKQVVKVETEPQFSLDIYLTVPKLVKPFLFTPEYQGSASIFTFSGKFASEADLLAHKRQQLQGIQTIDLQNIGQKLATLRSLSSTWMLNHKDQAGQGMVGDVSFKDKELDQKVVEQDKRRSVTLNGDEKKTSKKSAQISQIDEFDVEDKPKRLKTKGEKQAEESFFLSRKGGEKVTEAVKSNSMKMPASKKALKDKVEPVGKSVKQKDVKAVAGRAPVKARLRPLIRKAASSPAPKEKPPQKKKATPLRLLRRSKKK